ncbi:MAG: CpsD/CapB family tyrosine-protein kinase [Methanobacterium sp.]
MAGKIARQYELFAHKYPKSSMAEAYRTLRTNLGFASMDKSYRSILFSSTSPRDGKSSVASNLAVVMAQAGNRVVLIDADLRKPVQHRIFETDNRLGFTNCLIKDVEVETALHNGMVENLYVLTSGPIPPNPAEILASSRTEAILQELLEKYDYVFIDAPPVLAVTDAAILSTIVDGVVLVVSYGTTRNDLARKACEQFEKANAKVIGVVLNQVKMETSDYKYYYYYSHDDEKSKRA